MSYRKRPEPRTRGGPSGRASPVPNAGAGFLVGPRPDPKNLTKSQIRGVYTRVPPPWGDPGAWTGVTWITCDLHHTTCPLAGTGDRRHRDKDKGQGTGTDLTHPCTRDGDRGTGSGHGEHRVSVSGGPDRFSMGGVVVVVCALCVGLGALSLSRLRGW